MLIAKWGSSLAVRLPASVVAALDLRQGDDIKLFVTKERTLGVSLNRDNPALKPAKPTRIKTPNG